MRSVICHFYNEEYLLPWWLRHHRSLFDHGVLIDHGSTDSSIEICRELVPNWRIVRSRHIRFDAFLTDHEVMEYELSLQGWKVALNVTEFLLPARSMEEIEAQTIEADKSGFAVTGVTAVDTEPSNVPSPSLPLPVQKHWGIDDNAQPLDQQNRFQFARRNRYYHRAAVGMYFPGRHGSYHPDSKVLRNDIFVLHFGYAPWTEAGIARKLQIGPTLAEDHRMLNWGSQHHRTRAEWDAIHAELASRAVDLASLPGFASALEGSAARWLEAED